MGVVICLLHVIASVVCVGRSLLPAFILPCAEGASRDPPHVFVNPVAIGTS